MGSSLSKSNRVGQDDNDAIIPKLDNDYFITTIKSTYVFIWCDPTIGLKQYAADTNHTFSRLSQLFNQKQQFLHAFNDAKTCQKFISQVKNVCLVVSGSLGSELVPHVHDLEQIHSIYIFCMNKEKNNRWARHFGKIRGVYTDIQSICHFIESNILPKLSINHTRLEFDIMDEKIDLPAVDQISSFEKYPKLLPEILLNMMSIDRDEQRMFDDCRSIYVNDYLRKHINEIEKHYRQTHPILLYTRDVFLRRIVNYALLTNDLYTLSSMHRFINDINTHLIQIQNQTSAKSTALSLYFSQLLSEVKLNRIRTHCGGILTINQFVSANLDQVNAMMYMKHRKVASKSEKKIRVLFHIMIDETQDVNVPYANIASVSEFSHPKEYLISIGGVYHVDRVEMLVGVPTAWLIQLTLIGKNHSQYKHLSQITHGQQLEQHIKHSEFVDQICCHAKRFKSTNELFRQACQSQYPEYRQVMFHYSMATILASTKEWKGALKEYRHALDIARKHFPTCQNQDDVCLIPLYSQMGFAFQQDGNFADAFSHAFRALTISNKSKDTDLSKELSAACYHNLGLIHDHAGKFDDAKKFYEEALGIRREYLPSTDADIIAVKRCLNVLTHGASL
jgi:hypothetical protein